MSILEFSVSGYRSLQDLTVSLNHINVITGPNDCGKSDCIVNRVLESLKIPNKLAILNCSVNNLKFLDLSQCHELEMLLCDDNKLESIIFPKNGKISTLISQKNKLKILDLSGLVHLRNETLNIDSNPLEELYLEGTDRFIQNAYNRYQTGLLFKKLEKILHDFDKKQIIIKELGDRYTYFNCLKHLGLNQTAIIFSEQVTETVSSVSNFLPSFMSLGTEESMETEKNLPPLKREREEKKEPGNPEKRRKGN